LVPEPPLAGVFLPVECFGLLSAAGTVSTLATVSRREAAPVSLNFLGLPMIKDRANLELEMDAISA